VVDPCPLCEATDATEQYDLAYAVIWDALETFAGRAIARDIRARNTPAPRTSLVRCRACGLEYFSPVAPGDASFYETLDDGAFYHESRWDMDAVASRLPMDVSLLDVGCGRGAFLRRVHERTARAVGIDHNREAIATLVDAGFDARTDDLDAVAGSDGAAFDVVTALHVVEHLPRIEPFVESAKRCLRPGGTLIIAVPHRDHYALDDFEPLDCPPHHVSRWSEAQFDHLARAHGLALADHCIEPLPLLSAVHIAALRAARRLPFARTPAPPEHRRHDVPLPRRARFGLSLVGWFVTPR